MERKQRYTILLLLAVSSSSAFAYDHDEFQHNAYFGLGYSYLDVDLNSTTIADDSADVSMAGAIVGYQFHRNFALDLRGYGPLSDETVNGDNVTVNRSFSVLGRAIAPMSNTLSVYGVVGYTDSTHTEANTSQNDEEMQYGAGVSVNNGKQLELQVEWMNLYDQDEFKVKGINANLVYRF